MSGSLLQIRKKSNAVRNTRKITKAMQLVAASKMQRFQRIAVHSRSYLVNLLAILRRQIAHKADETNFLEKRTSGPILFVVYTSDKGLCGALNNQILRGLVRSEKWLSAKEDERLLITIGKKSYSFARANKIRVEKQFHSLPENLDIMEALKVIEVLLTYWKEKKCREIVFLSPHFKNSFTYYPLFKTLLPFSDMMVENYLKKILPAAELEKKIKNEVTEYMIYEPSASQIRAALYEQTIQTIFITSFLELKASEYSSRMIAMQNATDAADRIIKGLTLTYNKTRQQAITSELAELIGASEAMKE